MPEQLLGLVSDHAALIADIATMVRDMLARSVAVDDGRHRHAESLSAWERRADAIVVALRAVVAQTATTSSLCFIAKAADDVSDELAEAAFQLSLASGLSDLPDSLMRKQRLLAQLLAECAQCFATAVEAARLVHPGRATAGWVRPLEITNRIGALEYATDSRDLLAPNPLAEIVKDLERAADGFMNAALLLRDPMSSDDRLP
jgi:uncharacterized protein Yka (UPF0111/DUF47 family)